MKLNKILSIPVALMMLLAVTAVPTMACSPLAPCSAKSSSGMGSNINVVETQLIGQDAAKLTIEASGNIGKENRKNPYPPNFRSTPAKMTEPAVGASTCASGNQV